MKQFFFGLLACGLAAALPARGATDADMTGTAPAAASDPSLCLDSMETVPDDDDLVPTPAAVDGGCSIPEAPLST